MTKLLKRMQSFRAARPEVRYAIKAYYAGLASGFIFGVLATFALSIAVVVAERMT